MGLSVYWIALGVVGAVFCAGQLLLTVMDRYRARVISRLRELPRHSTSGSLNTAHDREPTAADSQPSLALRRWWKHLAPAGGDDRQRHQLRLLQAGIYDPTALNAYFGARLACMVAPPAAGLGMAMAGTIDPHAALLAGSILGNAGMIVPSVWLDRRIAKRHRTLRRSLSDFLDLMIVCLEGGLGLHGAIRKVTDELRVAHPLLTGELNIVQRDIELGATIDAAFKRFADRSGAESVRMLSTFIREAQRFGTELAGAMRSNADMLRSQREQAAEEMAQKASVKILLPMLLLILPAVFIVLAGPAAIKIQESFAK